MPENPERPKNTDAVLGSQDRPPVDGVVLGGFAGVQQRLTSKVIQHRIAALYEAIKYGDRGLELVIQAVLDKDKQVQVVACSLLQGRVTPVSLLEKGVAIWNWWRSGSKGLQGLDVDLSGAKLSKTILNRFNFSQIKLIGADLSEASLREAHLRVANLRNANLSGADLSGADLSGANLIQVNFTGANLSWAKFSHAYPIRANLSSANLHGANLSGANLREADFRGAYLYRANFSGADLQGAIMADGTIHE